MKKYNEGKVGKPEWMYSTSEMTAVKSLLQCNGLKTVQTS